MYHLSVVWKRQQKVGLMRYACGWRISHAKTQNTTSVTFFQCTVYARAAQKTQTVMTVALMSHCSSLRLHFPQHYKHLFEKRDNIELHAPQTNQRMLTPNFLQVTKTRRRELQRRGSTTPAVRQMKLHAIHSKPTIRRRSEEGWKH